jgi:predicted transcriptional regulator
MKVKENKSMFLKQFGDTPQLRVLDFLIDNYNFDFPMTEIARESNVSYNSIKIFFPYMISSGMIIKTRHIGKSFYYILNLENQFVRNLMKLDWSLVEENFIVINRGQKKVQLVEA